MLLKIQFRIQNYSQMFLRFSWTDSIMIEKPTLMIGILKFLPEKNLLRLLSRIWIKVNFPLERQNTYFG